MDPANRATLPRNPSERIARLKTIASEIEGLASQHCNAIAPLQTALQALVDTPLAEREAWSTQIAAVAESIRANELLEWVTELRDAERWTRASESGNYGRAIAGHAFSELLDNLCAGTGDIERFFTRLDEHQDGLRTAPAEICDVLGYLLNHFIHRTAGKFVEAFRAYVAEIDCTGILIPGRLAEAGSTLSPNAIQSLRDWESCSGPDLNFSTRLFPKRDPSPEAPIAADEQLQPVDELADLPPLEHAIRVKRLEGLTEGQIVAFISTPEGKQLRVMVDAELARNPKTRKRPQRDRNYTDVIRAALRETYPSQRPKS